MKAKLARTNPVRVGGVAQPVNGEVRLYGAKAPDEGFADIETASPIAFDSAVNVTVTIPKSSLSGKRFFKPAIVGE